MLYVGEPLSVCVCVCGTRTCQDKSADSIRGTQSFAAG